MAKKWSQFDEKGLARFVTGEAIKWLALPESPIDVVQSRGFLGLIELIYRTLYERQPPIWYAMEDYSADHGDPEGIIQLIREPDEILDKPRQGTCLDLTVLFAGLCLGYELLPAVIVLERHAFVAVSLRYGRRKWGALDRKEYKTLADDLLKDPKPICDWIDAGSYVAIECTGFADAKSLVSGPEGRGRDAKHMLSFERALHAGREHLNDNSGRKFRYAFDVAIAQYRWMFESLVAEVKEKAAKSEYVTRAELLETLNLQGPEEHEKFIKEMLTLYGADDRKVLEERGEAAEHVSLQIKEIVEAENMLRGQGVDLGPQVDYGLGLLTAFRKDYDSALTFLGRAQKEGVSAAGSAYMRLQQTLMEEDALQGRLTEAVERAKKWANDLQDPGASYSWLEQVLKKRNLEPRSLTDAIKYLGEPPTTPWQMPDNPMALVCRGYNCKTAAELAQLGKGTKYEEWTKGYYRLAHNAFKDALRAQPDDAAALIGLGDVKRGVGQLDAAVKYYTQAIKVAPERVATHYDLAKIYQTKIELDPKYSTRWAKKALATWEKTFDLASTDSALTTVRVAEIADRISDLKTRLKMPVVDYVVSSVDEARGKAADAGRTVVDRTSEVTNKLVEGGWNVVDAVPFKKPW
jgi:tetratricopeptide (TPR) repeat protein